MVSDGPSSRLSHSFIFIRSLESLDMTAMRRSSILTFLECQSPEHTWRNLKNATVELFRMRPSSSSPGKGDRSVLHANDVVDGSVAFRGEISYFPFVKIRVKAVATTKHGTDGSSPNPRCDESKESDLGF